MTQMEEDLKPEEQAEEFDAGFEIPANDTSQSDGTTSEGQDVPGGDTSQPQQEDTGTHSPLPAWQEEPVPGAHVQPQPEPQPAAQSQTVPQAQPAEPRQLETVPEELADELKDLEAISPAAAKLALEDSPEGAAVRERLTNYGAAMAQDRAEFVLAQRMQAQRDADAEAERNAAAVRAHNENFMGTIRRELPEYFALVSDPARKAEAAKYQQDVFGWIGSKPYAEAVPLMEIAKTGRDPNQIVSLLKQFESERRGGKTRPDPTGALAVPGRGAPTAPAGIGDKDDFEAGWNLK